ncbi:MAG TPA: PH domain-containing protein [Nakamurella sp.]
MSRPATGVPDGAAPTPPAPVPVLPHVPLPEPDPAAQLGDSVGSLPLIGDAVGERHRLSRRAIAYWRWRWLLSLLPALLLLAALAIVIPWGDRWLRWSAFLVLAAAGFIGVVILPPIRYRVFWYAISPTEIDIQHGIVFIKRSVIPMHRVQSLRVERGPIADHYRMSTLRISTAASTLSVSGLDRPEADDVCTRISELADVADDV